MGWYFGGSYLEKKTIRKNAYYFFRAIREGRGNRDLTVKLKIYLAIDTYYRLPYIPVPV